MQLGLDDFEPGGGGVELRLQRAHLGHHAIGALALGLELADLLAQAVALALQVFGAGLQRLALGLQRPERCDIEVGLGIFSLFKTRDDGVEVFSQGEYV